MKANKSADWKPLDLVDKEAIEPLCPQEQRRALRNHKYCILGSTDSSVYELDHNVDLDEFSDTEIGQYIVIFKNFCQLDQMISDMLI